MDGMNYLIISCFLLALSLGPAERSPIPGKLEQGLAREFLGGILEVQATDRKVLREAARQMLDKAREIAKDEGDGVSSGVYYVLLETGRDLAERGGDPELAVEAVDRLDERFEIDGLGLKLESLKRALRAIRDKPELTDFVYQTLELSLEGVQIDNYDHARNLCNLTRKAVRPIKSPALEKLVKRRVQEVSTLSKGFKQIARSLETLKEKPDDPKANTAVGEFYCFRKHDWTKGLPHLARGDDLKRKEVARAELVGPEEVWYRIKLAGQWLKLAKKAKKKDRASIHLHARVVLLSTDAAGDGLARVKLSSLIQNIPGKFDLELRITGSFDGTDELRISQSRIKWAHKKYKWPSEIRINGERWNPEISPSRPLPGNPASPPLDFHRAVVMKKKGRGPVEFEVVDRVLIVTITDNENGVASYDLEIVVPFGG